MIFIMVYPGHDAGLKESVEVENYLSTLSHQHYKVTKTYLPFQDHRPPYLIMIYKQKRT